MVHTTPPNGSTPPHQIPCDQCRDFVELCGPLFDRARARRESYRHHGREPRGEEVLLRRAQGDLGLRTLRGQGARRRRLLNEIREVLGDSPARLALDWVEIADDTGFLRQAVVAAAGFVLHLVYAKASPMVHAKAVELPAWAIEAAGAAVKPREFKKTDKRLGTAITAAADRIVAEQIGISIRTVQRRKLERLDWWEVLPGGRYDRTIPRRRLS